MTQFDEVAVDPHAAGDDDFIIEDEPLSLDQPILAPTSDDLGFDAMLDAGLDLPGAQTMQIAGATLGPEMTRTAEGLYTQLASTVAWFRAQLQLDRPRIVKVLLCGGG